MFSAKISRHLLRSAGRGTLYPWTQVCLPIKSVLVGTHVRCEEKQLYSFRARGDRGQARASLEKPWFSTYDTPSKHYKYDPSA